MKTFSIKSSVTVGMKTVKNELQVNKVENPTLPLMNEIMTVIMIIVRKKE